MSIIIDFLSQEKQHSEYDWVDIVHDDMHIGKARCKRTLSAETGQATITIYSINIYPEWAGHGYGRQFIEYCKKNYAIIIADRVRFTAMGFWKTLGFRDDLDGNWSYRNPLNKDTAS